MGRVSTVGDHMVRWRRTMLFIGILTVAIAYPASRSLEFNRSVSAMFGPNDKTFVDYQELRESFGGNSVVILVYRDDALKTKQGLVRNQEIADRVKGIPGVEGVLSPAKLNRAVERIQPMSLLSSHPALFQPEDPVAQGFDNLFSGYTHSLGHTRAAIVALLDPNHPPETLDQLRRFSEELADQIGGAHGRAPQIGDTALVGEPVLINDAFDLIERDGARLAALTVALLSIVVVVSLADLRFVLLTAITIAWSVVVTRAAMVWLSINLSLVSSILTAIVTVVAVAAALHLGVRFRVARSRGASQHQATAGALSRLLLPVVWTCATDAAGFAALYASRILPIRQFGMMIAVAALAVVIAVVLFAPAVMMLPSRGFARFSVGRMQTALSRNLRRRCLRIANASIHHRSSCLVIACLCAVVTVLGIQRVKTETSFLNNFRGGSPVVQAYDEVETHFGGAGVWDVVIDAPEELTGEFLEHVRQLEIELRAIDIEGTRLTKVLSLADAEQIAGRASLSQLVSPASRLSFMSLTMPTFYKALITEPESGKRKLRIMLRSREHMDSEQKAALIQKVQQTVSEHLSSDARQEVAGNTEAGRVTGYYVLMARLVDQLVGDQWRCFFASGVLVWCLLVVATSSIRLATVALLPNLLPVFLVLASVGLFGGKINMGAAMIAAVSIGLSIDGSVHFLSSYQRSRCRGHDPRRAATHAAGNVGVPVILATIALVVGFGVLSTSDFIPTATFGTLVAATLTLGTVVNLTMLPAMVSWVDR